MLNAITQKWQCNLEAATSNYHFGRRMVLGGNTDFAGSLLSAQARIVVYTHALAMAREEAATVATVREALLVVAVRLNAASPDSPMLRWVLMCVADLTRSPSLGHQDFYSPPRDSQVLKDLHKRWLTAEGWLTPEGGDAMPMPSTSKT